MIVGIIPIKSFYMIVCIISIKLFAGVSDGKVGERLSSDNCISDADSNFIDFLLEIMPLNMLFLAAVH